MSKRSRKYFESFEEFDRLCHTQGICSPPKPKRQKSNSQTILAASPSLSPSPSPPHILSITANKNNKSNKKANNKVFDQKIFYIAHIGLKNKRTNIRKTWNDLNVNRTKIFKSIIPNNGGQIIENITEFITNNNNAKLTIIVSEKINKTDFNHLFDATLQNNKNVTFVTPEYVTTQLKYKNQKISLPQFKPKCLTQKHSLLEVNKIKKQSAKSEMDIDEKETDTNDRKPKPKPKQPWLDRNKEKFACQIENDGQRVNFNSNITDIFDEMESIYACTGDKWREYGYKKANGFIKKYPHKIRTEKDIQNLMKLKGFSKKLGKKVLEIIETGSLRKLNELNALPHIKSIQLFTTIFGVGAVTAQKWYNLGLRTLTDVKNCQKWGIKLQDRQKMGLKYYNDLLLKIPRTEIVEIEKFLKKEIDTHVCEGCKVLICGSYRRGKLRSGDIDVLVTHSNGEKTEGVLQKILTHFHNIGFLVDDLSVPSQRKKDIDEHDSYMGIGKLMDSEYKHYRHIDIKVYKPQHFAFAVLYFTGSDHFNRSMRYFAKKKGFTLSDTQLAPAIRHNNSKIVTFTARAIKCHTEQDIFEALGLKYIKPTDRNTYENFGQSFDAKSEVRKNENTNNTNVCSTP